MSPAFSGSVPSASASKDRNPAARVGFLRYACYSVFQMSFVRKLKKTHQRKPSTWKSQMVEMLSLQSRAERGHDGPRIQNVVMDTAVLLLMCVQGRSVSWWVNELVSKSFKRPCWPAMSISLVPLCFVRRSLRKPLMQATGNEVSTVSR